MEIKNLCSSVKSVGLFPDRTGRKEICGISSESRYILKIKFRQVLLNQYPGKNTLKAIINKVALMGERNDFRTRISRIL